MVFSYSQRQDKLRIRSFNGYYKTIQQGEACTTLCMSLINQTQIKGVRL